MIDADIKSVNFLIEKVITTIKLEKIKYKVPSINKIFPDLKNKKHKFLTLRA